MSQWHHIDISTEQMIVLCDYIEKECNLDRHASIYEVATHFGIEVAPLRNQQNRCIGYMLSMNATDEQVIEFKLTWL